MYESTFFCSSGPLSSHSTPHTHTHTPPTPHSPTPKRTLLCTRNSLLCFLLCSPQLPNRRCVHYQLSEKCVRPSRPSDVPTPTQGAESVRQVRSCRSCHDGDHPDRWVIDSTTHCPTLAPLLTTPLRSVCSQLRCHLQPLLALGGGTCVHLCFLCCEFCIAFGPEPGKDLVL